MGWAHLTGKRHEFASPFSSIHVPFIHFGFEQTKVKGMDCEEGTEKHEPDYRQTNDSDSFHFTFVYATPRIA